MIGVVHFPDFLLVSVLLILSPGPGTLSILGSSTGSRRAGFEALAGTSAGDLLLMAAAGIGAATVLAANPTAFAVLRYLGGAYLAWLGLKSLMSKAVGLAISQPDSGGAFRRSLFVTLLNPKAVLFFMAFFPQFVAPGAPASAFISLGLLFIAMNCIYQATLITFASWIIAHLDTMPRITVWINRLLGIVFILFGLRLAAG